MFGKVCRSMLGISKSNFSTTSLELENINWSNIIILCVFFHHSIFRNFKAKHVYSKCFFIAFLGISSKDFL